MRDLADELYAASGDDVGRPVRETVRAVAELPGLLKAGMPITVDFVARQLGVDKSTASRRLAVAERDGWIINREPRRGRPANLALGKPLPAIPGLPDLRLWVPADPPVKAATAQPFAGTRNATTSATGASRMRPISLVDSEAMPSASTG